MVNGFNEESETDGCVCCDGVDNDDNDDDDGDDGTRSIAIMIAPTIKKPTEGSVLLTTVAVAVAEVAALGVVVIAAALVVAAAVGVVVRAALVVVIAEVSPLLGDWQCLIQLK